ncbi:MAG: gliding motility-associated ABC transporter permease subunit GldF [Chitinophagales bacterium]|nr:gliding motility-associated ABC transporter permease subunit GldF [Bacteroidota bacterium]MCB9042764.1 gliding motility-associated ABC transporter permease subunit GldF [Chitinophagales bacterium]
MWNIFFKEINTFFSSLIGYLSIGIFLLVCSLLLWVFPDTSIIDYDEASLAYFFNIVPWIFLFLVPAICMRLFAEEIKSGTFELLATRPLSLWQIIGGKYLAAWALIVLALLPTLIYYYSVYQLGMEKGNIDTGATNGSYLGLVLLGGTFAAIGLFASSISTNQIVAFLLAVFLCFVGYQAFDALSQIPSLEKIAYFLQNLGIYAHYESISRGVVDSRDLIYFGSVIFFFLFLTFRRLRLLQI